MLETIIQDLEYKHRAWNNFMYNILQYEHNDN
jgi:hypothetical protein